MHWRIGNKYILSKEPQVVELVVFLDSKNLTQKLYFLEGN